MKKIISVITLGFLATVSQVSFAQVQNGQPNQQVESKKQEMMQKRVNIESESHQGRIQILQNADNCIKSAKTRDAYKSCEEQEKNSRKQLHEKIHGENEHLKQENQQLRSQHEQVNQQRMQTKKQELQSR